MCEMGARSFGNPRHDVVSGSSEVFRTVLTLSLDVDRLLVELRRGDAVVWQKRRQWVEFYALLATERASRRWISADRLSFLAGWARKQSTSVGSEVSAHLLQNQRGGVTLLEHAGRTKAWRLLESGVRVQLLPSPDAVLTWVAARSAPLGGIPVTLPWLRHVVRSQLDLQAGNTLEAEAAARSALEASHENIRARRIAALLVARAATSRTGRLYDVLDELQLEVAGDEDLTGDIAWGNDPLGRYIQARLTALAAIHSDAAATPSHEVSLT